MASRNFSVFRPLSMTSFVVECWLLAPVAQMDRASASEAGCPRSSRGRGIFFDHLRSIKQLHYPNSIPKDFSPDDTN